MSQTQLKALLASYGRSVLGAALALYMSGATDLKTLGYSLIAALAPVVLRAVNPNDVAFGIMPDAKAVDEALKAAKPKAKKTVAKKVASKK